MDAPVQIHLADRTVAMTAVLDLNHFTYGQVPCQLPCPVHKAGMETKFSARIYTDGYIFCFTCGKQYRPTEIHAALRNITREDAAVELLKKYPPTEEEIKKQTKEYHAPYKRPVPTLLIEKAYAQLEQHKLKVPLELYVTWVRKIHELGGVLIETEESAQPLQFRYFINQMRQALERTVK